VEEKSTNIYGHVIDRRDKKAFLSDQCKEIEGNNRMGKTRDLSNPGIQTYYLKISISVGLSIQGYATITTI